MRSCSKPDSLAAVVVAVPAEASFNSIAAFHHRLRAPRQPVDPPHAPALLTRLIFVEGRVNAAQSRFQRNPSLAPGLNQRPVERREQQQ